MAYVWVATGRGIGGQDELVTVHGSKASADRRAADLVNVILADHGLPANATENDWRDWCEGLRSAGRKCDVSSERHPVQP